MWVTGAKTDIWLVKALGGILLVEGIVFLLCAVKKEVNSAMLLLSALSALSLFIIDLYYYVNNIIGFAYFIDACLEYLLFVSAVTVGVRRMRNL